MDKIHPLQPLGVIILIIVLIYVRRKKNAREQQALNAAAPRAAAVREKVVKPAEPPEVVHANLRRQALQTTPDRLNLPGHLKDEEAYGLLMEMVIGDSVVTLACFGDGNASLYYQSGGGMVGGIAHESVRKAAKDCIALTQRALPRMSPTDTYPLPGAEEVRFYALTPRGVLTAGTDRQELAEAQDELSVLFASGREVVTQMRQVQEQKAAAAPAG
jgi:hypothetical protein